MMNGNKKTSRRKYTQEELNFIKETYKNNSASIVTKLFNEKFYPNRTYKAIKNVIIKYNFKTGHVKDKKMDYVIMQKGAKQIDFMSNEAIEKTKITRFKKGQIAHNSYPVGYERPNKDDYIEVKISGPVGENKKKSVWKLKHHLLWEEKNGPIPPKHKIIFADGDKRNFNMDNLILISDSEFLSMRKYGLRYTNSIDAANSGIIMTKILRKVNGVHNNAKT